MKNDLIRKSFFFQKKSAKDDGTFSAVIATLGIIDKDGDVTRAGFLGKQGSIVVPVHDWDHVPIGKAMVSEVGNEVIASGKINLDIQSAKDWHSAMKFDLEEGDPMMEWSYGFKILNGGSSVGELNGKKVRFLQPMPDGSPGCKLYEVSPVVVGAGEHTRTLIAKGADTKGKRFCDEILSALDAVGEIVERGEELASIRAKEGRELSQANKERLALLAESLAKSARDVTALLAPHKVEEKAGNAELEKEVARMIRLRAGIVA